MEEPVEKESAAAADSSWRALGLLFNKTWLLNTLQFCRIFSSRCVLPAVLLTASGLCLTVGEFFSFSQINPANAQLASILAAMGLLIATMLLVLAFLMSGFWLWLARLSAFSHAFFAIDMSSKLPTTSEIQQILASSQAFVLSRKKYLGQFYLVLSLVLITPVLVFLTLFSVKALTMTPPNSGSLAMKVVLPPVADVAISLALAIIGGYLVGVSFCAIAVSSSSKETANLAAWDCIKLSGRMFLPMMAITIVVAVMNTVIATPQFCLHPIEYICLASTPQTLPSSICSELWEGITSVILFTFTLAPFCELLRYRLK